jgi:hypothetical protein
MMSEISILIAYQPPGCERALALARTSDRALLRAAAKAAVSEKRREGERLAGQDSVLGMVGFEELRRLQRTLKAVGAL